MQKTFILKKMWVVLVIKNHNWLEHLRNHQDLFSALIVKILKTFEKITCRYKQRI